MISNETNVIKTTSHRERIGQGWQREHRSSRWAGSPDPWGTLTWRACSRSWATRREWGAGAPPRSPCRGTRQSMSSANSSSNFRLKHWNENRNLKLNITSNLISDFKMIWIGKWSFVMTGHNDTYPWRRFQTFVLNLKSFFRWYSPSSNDDSLQFTRFNKSLRWTLNR